MLTEVDLRMAEGVLVARELAEVGHSGLGVQGFVRILSLLFTVFGAGRWVWDFVFVCRL